MRVTTAFKRLVRLDGVNVTDVEFQSEVVAVTVALKRRRLLCPHCSFSTSARYDTRIEPSSWRHLDLGTWALEIRCRLRRLACPTHGVVVEGVPFARPGAHLTRDYDDQLAGFSNWGVRTVDVAAPGVGTYTTANGGGYSSFGGTRAAGPACRTKSGP